jgi:hypothetical protein
MHWTIEPVLGLQSRLPDRPKDRREDEPRRREKKTFDTALLAAGRSQEAREAEDGRPNNSGA